MIDLHLHLDGSLEPYEIIKLAELDKIQLPTTDKNELAKSLTVSPDCRSLPEYLEKFDLPLRVLQSEKTLRSAVKYLVERLALQGLCYAEIRFAPQLHLSNGLTQNQVVGAAVRGLNEACNKCGMPAQLILCCMCGADNEKQNLETVAVAKEYLHRGVCAVDLAGNEFAYSTENFAKVFYTAKDSDVPIIIHAGEARGAENVCDALKLGAVRIGHGIRSVEDPELLQLLREKNIALETCFTSNLQTKAVSDAEHFPLKKFIESGIVATVNTDNMTVSGTTLKKEYSLVAKQFGFSPDEMQQLALNAANASFMMADEKELIKTKITNDFKAWLYEGRTGESKE